MEVLMIGLLAVIAIAEVHRSYLSVRPRSKKAYFKSRLESTTGTIWDLEFKVFKTREIREEIRQSYDQMCSRIQSYDEQIKNWPADKPEAERKTIEDQKVLAERDAERYVKQMQMLDAEVDGLKPTAENPQGQVGINEQIDSLREVQGMLKDYLASI